MASDRRSIAEALKESPAEVSVEEALRQMPNGNFIGFFSPSIRAQPRTWIVGNLDARGVLQGKCSGVTLSEALSAALAEEGE